MANNDRNARLHSIIDEFTKEAVKSPLVSTDPNQSHRVFTTHTPKTATNMGDSLKAASAALLRMLYDVQRELTAKRVSAFVEGAPKLVVGDQTNAVNVASLSFTKRRYDGVPELDETWATIRFLAMPNDADAKHVALYMSSNAGPMHDNNLLQVDRVDIGDTMVNDAAEAASKALLRIYQDWYGHHPPH